MPRDKIGHAAAGAGIALLSLALGLSPLHAMALVTLAAIGKELWDATGRGTPDPWDAVATLAGGALILPIYLVC